MSLEEFLAAWNDSSDRILVHTSGSTGTPKPLWVEKRRMEASARITCRFLGLQPGDTALLCMPLDYIAGKMMVVRALTCGLRLIAVEPCGCPSWDENIDFAAMVPMQVYNLLQTDEGRERLMQIRHLIIGGGAIDDALSRVLIGFPNQIWSTYGMTETLSHIALRRLSGPEASAWYTPFEGVSVSLSDEGCLIINAPAVHDGSLLTNDIAQLMPSAPDGASSCVQGGRVPFRILGRKDNTICSGGVKIQIEEVERLLHPHLSCPFLITKCRDVKFGEAVVLLTESSDLSSIRHLCQQHLPRFWQPRRYLTVPRLPLTATGKPARGEAQQLAEAGLL